MSLQLPKLQCCDKPIIAEGGMSIDGNMLRDAYNIWKNDINKWSLGFIHYQPPNKHYIWSYITDQSINIKMNDTNVVHFYKNPKSYTFALETDGIFVASVLFCLNGHQITRFSNFNCKVCKLKKINQLQNFILLPPQLITKIVDYWWVE